MIRNESLDTSHHRYDGPKPDDLQSGSRLRRCSGSTALATIISILILLSTGIAAATTVVGRYTIVPEGLKSTKAGNTRAYGTRVGANVVVNEQIESSSTSAAQFLFGDGAVINLAPETSLRIGESVDEAGGKPVPVLELMQGLLRVFVSRTWNQESGVRIFTPAGIVVIVAAEVAVETGSDGSVRVAHLGGIGPVNWWAAGSAEVRDLAPKSQWLITAAVGSPDAEPLAASTETEIRRRTEPLPFLPQKRPRARSHQDYGPSSSQGRWQAPGESATVHSGLCGRVIYNPGAARFVPNPVSTEIQVFDDSGILRAMQTSDARGGYQIPLDPGHYRVVLPDYGVVFNNVTIPDGICFDPELSINAP